MPSETDAGVTDPGWPMERAVGLAAKGPAHGPNPRVGAVLVAPDGSVVGEGWHDGAGTPHAEVAAIANAASRGASTVGTTAFVTLEPCAHSGRTGPCTDALTAAGVAQVVYAVPDPNPVAAGGASVLTERGIGARWEPHSGAVALNERWLVAVARQRPYVIAKWAQTVDGRIAARDGSSFWITGEAAREHAHHVRAEADAIVVGTQTVIADDPLLSARPGGADAAHQPLRVVMGLRETNGARIWRDKNAVHIATHEPATVLDVLHERQARTVIVEGGAGVLTAFLREGLVDELNVYIAPALLGAGITAIGDLGIATMGDALRAERVEVTSLGMDTLVRAHMAPHAS
jgi:diaminohydroxyphosphoribosylaminopyrimidine deaminase/5-amino-6-(5-phosphoribosylamino)uracil reductase